MYKWQCELSHSYKISIYILEKYSAFLQNPHFYLQKVLIEEMQVLADFNNRIKLLIYNFE